MDHKASERMGAADKYLLGELTAEQRSEFEEHFFDCPICADRVMRDSMLIENLKEVFREDKPTSTEKALSVNDRDSWRNWFRLSALIPSLAALVLAVVLGYENFVLIPALKAPQVLPLTVITVPRGSDQVVTVDRRVPRFALSFMVDSPKVYLSYNCEFLREGKESILRLNSGEHQVASFTLTFLLPTADFKPGHYTMVLRPESEPHTEISQFNFEIKDGSRI